MGRTMVMMLDPDGLPRAWGIAATEENATKMAERELEKYRAEKRAVGDPLADAVFTKKVERVV